jgi:hypothetical protein
VGPSPAPLRRRPGAASTAGRFAPLTADLWIGNSRLLWIGRSSNHAFAYEYWVRGHSLYLGTPFFSGAPGEVRPAQGWGAPGTQCRPRPSPAEYAWAFSELPRWVNGPSSRALVLKPMKEPCAQRRRLLAGVWQAFGV